MEEFLQLTEQWLASIPATPGPAAREADDVTPLTFKFPERVVNRTVRYTHLCDAEHRPHASDLHTLFNQCRSSDSAGADEVLA